MMNSSTTGSITSPLFQLTSDDELEDHMMGLEDFQSVTLEIAHPEATQEKAKQDIPHLNGLDNLRGEDGNYSGASGHVPKISLTPMTPTTLSPDGESTVSLNSSRASPLFQNHGWKGQGSALNQSYWRPQSPMPPKNELEAKDFFAYRDSIIEHLQQEVGALVVSSMDGNTRGTWLLTEIDHWDHEKERIVVLCQKTMLIIKYDFIVMKTLDVRRINLSIVDKIQQGELKYPDRSLAPRLSGIAGGLLGVVKDCIIPKVSDTVSTVGNTVFYRNKACMGQIPRASSLDDDDKTTTPRKNRLQANERSNSESQDDLTSPKSIMNALSLENFEPRSRNTCGARIMWNQEQPITFSQNWNPFDKSIPWTTFASHPLLWHKGEVGGGGNNRSFDIESFSRELMDILSNGEGGDTSPMCRVEYKPIIIESYLGIGSLFHNANALGFYKIRGKISF